MDRRTFIKLITSGAVGYTLDVDKLLWVPGEKTFFLPAPKPIRLYSTAEIIAAEMERIAPHIAEMFENQDLFYRILKPIE
jgi:hypothetical protein